MTRSDIFGPILSKLIGQGRPTTNAEIERHSGIKARRVADLRKNPEKITLGELEALTDVFRYEVKIGRTT